MDYGLPTMVQSFKNLKCPSGIAAHFVQKAYVGQSFTHLFKKINCSPELKLFYRIRCGVNEN